jgi:hypothetical protein
MTSMEVTEYQVASTFRQKRLDKTYLQETERISGTILLHESSYVACPE